MSCEPGVSGESRLCLVYRVRRVCQLRQECTNFAHPPVWSVFSHMLPVSGHAPRLWPCSQVPAPPSQTPGNFSECAMKGLAVKPKKGTVVAFWHIQPDGRFDAKSLHGSCPVIEGEKWSAPKVGRREDSEVRVCRAFMGQVTSAFRRVKMHVHAFSAVDIFSECTELVDPLELINLGLS